MIFAFVNLQQELNEKAEAIQAVWVGHDVSYDNGLWPEDVVIQC